MRRRDFISLVGGSAVAWPLAARAQQPAMPVIGYLYLGTPEGGARFLAAFRKGLSETGFVEGQNVAIEFRWAHNELDRLAELAADLVRRRVAVITTLASNTAALAAKAATTTIPIVFQGPADPVQIGLVASLNWPGGNVTGLTSMNVEIGAKRIELLQELLPAAARFAVLVNPSNAASASVITDLQAAAAAVGRQIEFLTAGTNRDIETAFASLVQKRIDALLVMPDQFFNGRRVQIVTLAMQYAIPVLYYVRDFPEAGGLMSYGTDLTDQFRQAGIYVGRILKGEKPADLPVMQATQFEFVINLQTARTLGLTVPPTLLALATEVIE
jgi:putative tryptophan/tyrosine transport system substrate-binding protein